MGNGVTRNWLRRCFLSVVIVMVVAIWLSTIALAITNNVYKLARVEEETTIVNELINRRTENSKTYRLSNGDIRLVVSMGAVHYKDDYSNHNEEWKDIDLTWKGNKITKAPYELMLDGRKLVLKDKKTGEISTIELVDSKPKELDWAIVAEYTRVKYQINLSPDEVPFEATYKVTGDIPFASCAYDDEGGFPLQVTFSDGILTEKLEALPRQVKGNISVDPTWQVGLATDDCRRYLTGNQWLVLTNMTVDAGYYDGTNYQGGSGMRFSNVTIPQGAALMTGAYLTLNCDESRSGTDVKSYISAEGVDDAVTFADDRDAFDTRFANHTATMVSWDNIEAWTIDTDYNSPDISSVLQEIFDRSGWESGNAIVLFWEDFDDRSTHSADCLRRGKSYYRSSEYAPKLTIDWDGITASVANIVGISYSTSIALSWTTVEDSISTVIRHSTTGYPATPADGVSSYNGTGSYTTVTGLTPGTTYYFSAWGYDGLDYSAIALEYQITTLPAVSENTTIPFSKPSIPSEATQDPDISGWSISPIDDILDYFADPSAAHGGLGMPVNNVVMFLAGVGVSFVGLITYIKWRSFWTSYVIVLVGCGFCCTIEIMQWIVFGFLLLAGMGVWAVEKSTQ